MAEGFEGVAAEMLRAFRPLAREPDPLDVEVFTSGLLGAWWDRVAPGDDPDVVLGLGVVDHAEGVGGRVALALLRALTVVGVTQEVRQAASAAAATLAASDVGEPPWASRLGRVEVGDCWRLADVYGDQASLLVVFGYGRERHGLVALVDFNHLGGWVKDVFVTAEPATVLRELGKAALSEPLETLDQIDPAEARRLLEGGLAATDQIWQPEVSEDFRHFRALALARCRILPEPAGPTEPAPEIGDAARDAIVEEFLGSAQAAHLPDGDAARFCARLLVDFGADNDGKPLRVSPARTEEFLHDWVPRKAVLDDTDRDALPAVVIAWVRWAGERAGLPGAAIDEVVEVATECGAHFGEADEDSAAATPARLLLRGLTVEGGPEALRDAIDRRLFAMPFFGTEIDGEDFPELDPGDPDERNLLIKGEHPEYHRALADPFFDGEVDGVNPRLHLALHEVVANQLWDDDPPAAWQAARRLRDAGVDRHDVLHQLAGVAATHLHRALTDQQPVDPAGYDRALDALRPPRARQARGRARGARSRQGGPTGQAVYQVKISLRGASPPIWRRLRLPAATSLGRLHHVIQAAFGWEDSHLHDFEAGGRRYSRPEFGLESRQGRVHDEDKATLSAVAPRVGSRLRYTYDFGDSWEHELVVEKVLPPDGVTHAVCVAGRRAGPPEDCGGVWGYAELCEILADPDHPDYGERLEWLGDAHDPATFDQHGINSSLARLRLA